MSGFQFSPETLTFDSTFAGIPVVIGYEIEISEDHRGRDVEIIPTVCVIGETGVDLCEDAGFFHPNGMDAPTRNGIAMCQSGSVNSAT